MRIVDIIEKKRDGEELNREQIEALILGYVKGQVPDYQVAAFLMAVVFRGMTDRETAILTDVMMHSGDTVDHDPDRGTAGGCLRRHGCQDVWPGPWSYRRDAG